MNIPQIPNELLTDSFTLLVPNGAGYGKKTVDCVRIVEKSALSDYASSSLRGLSEITIYYDCEGSYPGGIEFEAGMCAQYNGAQWEIVEVKRFGVDSPHHFTITARKISG